MTAAAFVVFFACSDDNNSDQPYESIEDSSSSFKDPSSSSSIVLDQSSSSITYVDTSSSSSQAISSSSLAQIISSSSSVVQLSSSSNGVVSSSSFLLSSSSADGKSSSSSIIEISSSSVPPMSSSITVSSSSSWEALSSSLGISSSSEAADTTWDWLNNIENPALTYDDIPDVWLAFAGCGALTPPDPMDSLKTGTKEKVLEYYKTLADLGCFMPVQNKNNNLYYPVAAWPVTGDVSTLARPENPSDKLGLIFKGLLECMAYMGASNCKAETLTCEDGTNSKTLYRDYFASSTAYKNLIANYKNSKNCK